MISAVGDGVHGVDVEVVGGDEVDKVDKVDDVLSKATDGELMSE
jgi:hypothetical protein